MDLKRTALYDCHLQMGAKLVEFAGFEMPVRYSGLIDEHMAVRNSVGIFDVSHMGEFIVRGDRAIELIKKISTNDPEKLEIGDAQYSCMPNGRGGIVDDLLIYRLDEKEYLLVVNASNISKDWEWILSHNVYGVETTNISDDISLLAVQGPQAVHLVQKLCAEDLSQIKYYSFIKGRLDGIDNILISATGYTGAGGFELYVPSVHAKQIWNKLFEVAGDIRVLPAGLGARDTLRLEMGYCLYGNDINDETSPLEAGLSWITKFNHDFVDFETLLAQKTSGLKRRLVGFEMLEKAIPRQGYEVLSSEGIPIGTVTSGTMSPCLEKGIGMAYVNKPFDKTGEPILIQIRKNQVPALIVKTPFYQTQL